MSFFLKKYLYCLTVVLIFSFLIFLPKNTNAFFLFVNDPPNTFQGILNVFANSSTGFATTPISAVSDVVSTAKESVGDSLAFLASQIILKNITAQTVNWINNGFRGNPAFIENPERFFRNQADIIVNRALGEQLTNTLCTPFQLQVRLAIVKQYLSESQPPSCTLDRIAGNFEGFINNFENGGWTSWLSITTNSNNNPYGAYYKAQDMINLQVSSNEQKYNKQLSYGRGFLSFERCKTRAGSTNPRAGSAPLTGTVKQECVRRAPLEIGNPNSGQCLEYRDVRIDSAGNELAIDDNDASVAPGECAEKETVTPGSVIENQLTKALGSSVSKLEVADEINEIVSALMTQMFSRVASGISNGLKGLTQRNPGSGSSIVGSVIDRPTSATPVKTEYDKCVESGVNPSECEDKTALDNINNTLPPQAREIISPTASTTSDFIDEDAARQNVLDEIDYYDSLTAPPTSTTTPPDTTDTTTPG
jgi:hypothetical protein